MHRLDHREVRHFVLRLKEVGEMGQRCPVLYQRFRAEVPALPVKQEIIDGSANRLACPTRIRLRGAARSRSLARWIRLASSHKKGSLLFLFRLAYRAGWS